MPSKSPSALSLRLFAGDIEERLRLGADPSTATAHLVQLVREAAAWTALADLLGRLVRDKTPTLVYGDYDVDGSVSAYLLFSWLRDQGVPGNIFLPSRFSTGYGVDPGIVAKAKGQGYGALVALDCGTADLAALGEAKAAGLLTAVIDHHTPKSELPDCPVLNPHLEQILPPLCSAGLVFAALAAMDDQAVDPSGLLLAGLATISDMVPLTPPGWSLAHHALLGLSRTTNHGLGELMKVSRLHSLERITGRQVSFDLTPRLNAAGRMASAKLVPDLLLARNVQEARALALKLDQLNQQRRDQARLVGEEASAQALAFASDSALALASEAWHPGVVGIVAAKLAGQFCKPAVIFAPAPGNGGERAVLAGSVRSAGGVDVVSALEACSADLISFGGHAAAAGVKIRAEQLASFRQAWCEAVTSLSSIREEGETPPEPAVLRIEDLSAAFEDDVWRLAPYGLAHPAPQFRLRGCQISRVDLMGVDRTHLNLTLTDGTRQVRVAGFSMSHLASSLRSGQEVEPLVECEADNFNNRNGISLRLLAL